MKTSWSSKCLGPSIAVRFRWLGQPSSLDRQYILDLLALQITGWRLDFDSESHSVFELVIYCPVLLTISSSRWNRSQEAMHLFKLFDQRRKKHCLQHIKYKSRLAPARTYKSHGLVHLYHGHILNCEWPELNVQDLWYRISGSIYYIARCLFIRATVVELVYQATIVAWHWHTQRPHRPVSHPRTWVTYSHYGLAGG